MNGEIIWLTYPTQTPTRRPDFTPAPALSLAADLTGDTWFSSARQTLTWISPEGFNQTDLTYP